MKYSKTFYSPLKKKLQDLRELILPRQNAESGIHIEIQLMPQKEAESG